MTYINFQGRRVKFSIFYRTHKDLQMDPLRENPTQQGAGIQLQFNRSRPHKCYVMSAWVLIHCFINIPSVYIINH